MRRTPFTGPLRRAGSPRDPRPARTRRPRAACTSAAVPARFCSATTRRSPPAQLHPVARVHAEVDDVADHARESSRRRPENASSSPRRRIFSGRTLNGGGRSRRASPASGALEEVRDAHEVRHESGGGLFVDLGGRPHLLHAAAPEDGEPVAHGERLLLVVGDVDEGDAQRLLERLQLDLHLLAQLQVERSEGLVEEEHAGAVDEGAGQRDALPLAARELGRPAVGRRRAGARGRGPRARGAPAPRAGPAGP